MGLEVATYVGELVGTNPVASDNRSEGDDHLRLLKLALQATFPGMAGRFGRFQSKGTGYTPVVNDSNSVIYCTAAITLSLTAAATLGNGWATFVVASSGDVVIDPNASELVNGAATVTIPSGDTALLACTGTSFWLVNISATAIPATIVDAAGDLLVGSAANAIAKFPASASIAAHATTSNIWAARYNTLTGGVVTFTDLADAPYAGAWAIVVANDAHVFTDGANIEVQGNANYTATAGDILLFTAKTITTFQMSVLKENGRAPVAEVITLGTPQATTSGTEKDFGSIPAGTKRITINFYGVSSGGTSDFLVKIGDAGGLEETGYTSISIRTDTAGSAEATSTVGFAVAYGDASATLSGSVVLELVDASAFTWVERHTCGHNNGSANRVVSGSGRKALSDTLTQLRVTTVSGDTFDAGSINISYE
jgi:hypothetical protein